MKYKLIAVDLDGTLYNNQLKITSDTLNTMIKAQEMGIRIAPVVLSLVFFMPEIY